MDASETSSVIKRIFELYDTDRKVFAGQNGAFHCYKDLPQIWWLIKFANSNTSNLDQASPRPLSIAYLPEALNELIREREKLFDSNNVRRALYLLKELSSPSCDRSVYFNKSYILALFLARRLYLSTQVSDYVFYYLPIINFMSKRSFSTELITTQRVFITALFCGH